MNFLLETFLWLVAGTQAKAVQSMVLALHWLAVSKRGGSKWEGLNDQQQQTAQLTVCVCVCEGGWVVLMVCCGRCV